MTIHRKQWITPHAMVEVDFCQRRWHGGYVDEGGPITKGTLAVTNGAYTGNAYFPNKAGLLVTFPQATNTPNCITDLGLCVEHTRTNGCLQCRDLTQAVWNTVTSATVLKDQTGPVIGESGSTCCSILATGANAIVTQGITLASRIMIFSAYIKRLVGSGEIDMTCDGGTTWVNVTSQIPASGYGWVQIPQQTVTNPVCGFRIVTSADKIAVDFCQLEYITGGQQAFQLLTGDKASPPILTTTVAAARSNQGPYWGQSTGNVYNAGYSIVTDIFSSGRPWTMIASFNGDFVDASGSGGVRGPVFIASDFTFPASITCGGGTVGFGNNFTNKTSNVCNVGRGNWNIGAVTCGYKGSKVCLNGGTPSAYTLTSSTPNANPGATHFNIFNNGAGTAGCPLNGTVGRVAFLPYEMADAQLQLYTDLSGPFATFN